MLQRDGWLDGKLERIDVLILSRYVGVPLPLITTDELPFLMKMSHPLQEESNNDELELLLSAGIDSLDRSHLHYSLYILSIAL